MEHSELYYTMSAYHRFSFEPEAKAVENQAGFDLFRIGFKLYEGKSGMMIQRFRKERDLTDMVGDLEQDTGYQEKLKEKIEQWTAMYGTSPRYTHPERTRITESTPEVRARSLDDNGRHAYVEIYNEDGLALYARKSEMNRLNYSIYCLHQEWMFPVGQIYGLHWVAKDFSKHGPSDFIGYCTETLGQQMRDPDTWASLGCAAFLGRIDEAKEHNNAILEQREAHRQERLKRDVSIREFFREKNQEAYGPLVGEAAHAIAAHMPVENIKNPFGSSLILYLLDHYKIEVPARTRLWIAEDLQQISYDKENQAWTYTCVQRVPFDRSFPPVLEALVQAVRSDCSTGIEDTIHVDVDEDEWER